MANEIITQLLIRVTLFTTSLLKSVKKVCHVYLVMQSIRAGKYFPYEEMFIVDNSFWKICRGKNMSEYSEIFIKFFE